MKVFLFSLLFAMLAIGRVSAQDNARPGYLPLDESIDASVLQPDVNIHFPKFLLNDMAEDLKNTPDNPFAGLGIDPLVLVRDIQRVRLMVIQMKDSNRDAVLQAADKLNRFLQAGWVPLVRVTEENVGIYTVSDASGNKMAGMAIVIVQEDSAVFGNIEGSIPFGMIMKLIMNMDSLPADLFEKLGAGGQDAGSTEAPVLKTDPAG